MNPLALLKKKPYAPPSAEELHRRLKNKYEALYDGQTFWREFQAMDQELDPGCISVEPYAPSDSAMPLSRYKSDDFFAPGEKILVTKLKNPETATMAAARLNDFFKGTGTKFVAEREERDGKSAILLRGNIDKRHWEKLCVFCDFCFNLETGSPEERARLQADSQKAMNRYTKGTDAAGWRATGGVTAALNLWGLHGVLRGPRPLEPESLRQHAARKREELNAPHPRGTPNLFEGLILHADMNKEGDFVIFFDPHQAALDYATNGRSFGQLAREWIGADPLSKELAPGRRAMALTTATLGIYALVNIGEDMLAPILMFGSAAVAMGLTEISYLRELSRLRKGGMYRHGKGQAQMFVSTTKAPAILLDEPAAPEIQDAYTNGHARALLDGASADQARGHLIRAIIEAGSPLPENNKWSPRELERRQEADLEARAVRL